MEIRRIYKLLLFIGISVTLIAFNFKVMHWPGGSLLGNIAYVLTLLYVAIGIYIVIKDSSKDTFEKGAWAIGLVLLPPIIGLIYYHREIKRKNAST